MLSGFLGHPVDISFALFFVEQQRWAFYQILIHKIKIT
jgi:hypothetical protein